MSDLPTISLAMIAQDEEACLARCLAGARPLVDEIVVVDGGSNDGSERIARSYGARVVRRPWDDDFAAARNAALDLAGGDWALVLDADEWIEEAPSRERLRQFLAAGRQQAFSVDLRDRCDDGSIRRYPLVRLFRNDPAHRYEGRIHEQITPAIARRLGRANLEPRPSGIVVGHDGYLAERRLARDKAERNLRLLRLQLEERPDDPAARYFLFRERVPLHHGRAVPGAHLEEALALLEDGRWLGELVPRLARDAARRAACALLAARPAAEAGAWLAARGGDGPEARLLAATAAIAAGGPSDPQGIRRACEEITARPDEIDEGDWAPWVARARSGELMLALGLPDEARRFADEADAAGDPAALRAALRARIARHERREGEALRAWADALRDDPHDPWSWAELADVLRALGDEVEARKALANAAALAPGWQRVAV